MHHSDNKLGTLIERKGTLILARVPQDLRDPRVLRDTKVSARNIKGFSPLSFIVIRCYCASDPDLVEVVLSFGRATLRSLESLMSLFFARKK